MGLQPKLLTAGEIAELLSVRASAISNWRKRHRDFPRPREAAGQELFDAAEVGRWLAGRRVPRTALRQDETEGATYQHRFLRGAGQPAPVTGPPPAAPEQAPALLAHVEPLRAASGLGVDFLLGLLRLRVADPAGWAALVAAARGGVVAEVRGPLVAARLLEPDAEVGGALTEAVLAADEAEEPARVADALLARSDRGAGRRTPPPLARCLVELVDPRPGETVHDPCCGDGRLLVATVERGSAGPLSGQAADEASARACAALLGIRGASADLRAHGDGFRGELFDVVVAHPPVTPAPPVDGGGGSPRGESSARGAGLAWLQRALRALAPGGRAALLLPGSTTSGQSGRDVAVRRDLVEAGAVECVIALPGRSSRAVVWVLRAPGSGPDDGEVLFVDAVGSGGRAVDDALVDRVVGEHRRWAERGGRRFAGQDGFSRSASPAEIARADFRLAPAGYVERPVAEPAPLEHLLAEVDALHAELGGLRGAIAAREAEGERAFAAALAATGGAPWAEVPLGRIADVLAGPATLARGEGVPVVLPRNIGGGRVDRGAHDRAPARHDRHALRAGDVVCARTGTLGRYGVVGADQDGWLLGPGCLRLRPGAGVVPGYLAHFLNSPEGATALERLLSGGAVPHVTTRAMGELVVRLPPPAAQTAIAAALDAVDGRLALHRRVEVAERELRDLAFAALTLAR
ncbi:MULTISPECIES: type I restriction-modification system subunit M/S [Actinosynnema]|uniref:N-6 DNA methylase n=1 Tax=Actinosynnema TaxID=40566 RepID=UPI0020A6023B|nr:type I restriction-modification system subunit M/S [Actinosynnema pretiosum]MCP2097006.1 Type I restriction-modification system, DNA methylase subunit [Actinosynnema pretiosum]